MSNKEDKYKAVFWSYVGLAIIMIYLLIKTHLL